MLTLERFRGLRNEQRRVWHVRRHVHLDLRRRNSTTSCQLLDNSGLGSWGLGLLELRVRVLPRVLSREMVGLAVRLGRRVSVGVVRLLLVRVEHCFERAGCVEKKRKEE